MLIRSCRIISCGFTLQRSSKLLWSYGGKNEVVISASKLKLACFYATNAASQEDQEGAAHFKKSSIKHPLVKLDKPVIDVDNCKPSNAPYTLPHPVWIPQQHCDNRDSRTQAMGEEDLESLLCMYRVFQRNWPGKEMTTEEERRRKTQKGSAEEHVWSEDKVNEVQVSHYKPQNYVDWMAYAAVQVLRTSFDLISLYKIGHMDESKWLTRIILLETVAGVPGMVGAMTRHFHSLRRMYRDHGWIHTLLEEAENERMHLLTALELKQPGKLFRGSVVLIQGVFVNLFFIAYLISPRFCHRFVGYLEEEAVKTYTYCIQCIDEGKLPMWAQLQAPPIAKNYWQLADDALMRDVILAIRADEAHHRTVNHTFGSLQQDKQNPFSPGQ